MWFLIEEQKNADSQFNWHLKRRQPCIHVKYSRWSNRAMLFGLLVSISLIHFLIAFDYMRTNRDSDLLGRNEIPMLRIFSKYKQSNRQSIWGWSTNDLLGISNDLTQTQMWEHLFFSQHQWIRVAFAVIK